MIRILEKRKIPAKNNLSPKRSKMIANFMKKRGKGGRPVNLIRKVRNIKLVLFNQINKRVILKLILYISINQRVVLIFIIALKTNQELFPIEAIIKICIRVVNLNSIIPMVNKLRIQMNCTNFISKDCSWI